MLRPVWFLVSLSACFSGGTAPKAEGFEVHIAAPAADATFAWGEAIPLDVEVTQDGEPIEPDQVAWTIDAWTATGDGVSAEGVPAGNHVVSVAVIVDGIAGSATTPIRVEAPPDVNYAGPLHSTIDLSNGWLSGSATCAGTVTFVLREASVIDGTGHADCTWSGGDFAVDYDLDGTLVQGTATGTMASEYDGQPLSMPWTGTGGYGTAIAGAFDLQQSQNGGSLHLSGDFQADPQ
jgi:hypothetical protein